MRKLDLREDAKQVREYLVREIDALIAGTPGPISAIEVGYDCDQGGWIFLHADRRADHNRDGQWTNALDDDSTLPMPHWIEAIHATFEGEAIEVTKVDGTTIVIPPFDEEADEEEDEEDDGGPLTVAIGEMLLAVLRRAQADGVFRPLTDRGPVQLDIEDFNGGWGWPEYDDLGKTNLA